MKTILVGMGAVALLFGCDSGDAAKHWSAFSRCVAGEGAKDPATIAARIRSIELTERQPPKLWDAAKDWPGRCEPHANALFSSLGSSPEEKPLSQALKSQLGCKEGDAPQCTFVPKATILPEAARLWEAAAIAKFATDDSMQVAMPKYDVKLQTSADWKPLAPEGYELGDTMVTPSGALRLLLKSRGGPLLVCDVAAAAKCTPASDAMPKLAYQSVKLLRDEEAIITGLTPEGRQGFSAASGEPVAYRGSMDAPARDGVVIEPGVEGAPATAVSLVKGKPRGEAAFMAPTNPDGKPVSVGSFVSWTAGKDAEMKWSFATVAGKSLKDAATFSGDYAGSLHACPNGSVMGVWGKASAGINAAPTKGEDTAVHVSFLTDGEWSKPVSDVIPFQRGVTSSRCGDKRLELFWASSKAEDPEVGSLVCTPEGCKSSRSSWPSFGVKRWLSAGMAGDQFVALWTTELGDTRLRVGDAANFSNAKETVLFEDSERGGPLFREDQSFVTPHGVYLLVTDKGPTLLRVSAEGVQSVSP
jgi:hypothetical protein